MEEIEMTVAEALAELAGHVAGDEAGGAALAAIDPAALPEDVAGDMLRFTPSGVADEDAVRLLHCVHTALCGHEGARANTLDQLDRIEADLARLPHLGAGAGKLTAAFAKAREEAQAASAAVDWDGVLTGIEIAHVALLDKRERADAERRAEADRRSWEREAERLAELAKQARAKGKPEVAARLEEDAEIARGHADEGLRVKKAKEALAASKAAKAAKKGG